MKEEYAKMTQFREMLKLKEHTDSVPIISFNTKISLKV